MSTPTDKKFRVKDTRVLTLTEEQVADALRAHFKMPSATVEMTLDFDSLREVRLVVETEQEIANG